VDATSYQSIVGSLRYLVNSCPDIAFDVGYVSHFLDEPQEDQLAVVKKILHYVVGICNWRLWFGWKKGNQAFLTGFSDTDFIGDVDARKSTTGVIFFFANSPIIWQSMKQKVVVQSNCESEYITSVNATCQTLWLSRVLAEVKGFAPSTPLLKVDNKSAIVLIKNPVLHGQSKHIEVKYHLVWESIDILTKLLGRVKFLELHTKIVLIDVDGHNKA
jgi:hypothetical protein